MLTVEKLSKSFADGQNQIVAVNDVSFEVPDGKLFTLLGPSGCGKTTTLRCIAGLESPERGLIKVDDRVFFSSKTGKRIKPNERGLGMLFQSYAIWPHMTVYDNVAFPLVVERRGQRRSKAAIRERVEKVLTTVQLQRVADRPATDLSGGQQQRVALARALVLEPPLLLLDEPLSNLDAKLRGDMRLELKRLQREIGITTVYVTHDQAEALAMSNLVAVMSEGAIQQVGSPRDIYSRPASRFVADFIGSSNFIEGSIEQRDPDGCYVVRTAAGLLRASSTLDYSVGDTAVVSIRPEHVELKLGAPPSTEPNVWGGIVVMRGFLGEAFDHLVAVGPVQVRARTNPAGSVSRDEKVTILLPSDACSLVPGD
ncbi:MAG TPA: ABC transporter ATP-binding protein [Actinomycetota bacterium]|nr:ABC transporter ATP-binding protein [Actinomycetota bacterium]